ncbi:MAG: alpha/beta hydrolase [Bacteroidales bacterium]
MNKILILLVPILLMSEIVSSQKAEMVYLWPGKVPGEVKEKLPPVIAAGRNDNVTRYDEVTNPLLEVYRPDQSKSNGKAVIVCPGGGYRILAYDKEGIEVGAWLNSLGYTAFVLQYRIPDKKEGALQDAQRAIRLVRHNASRWNIDPASVGIMGFSAGGSLSARASTGFNRRTYPPVDAADSLSCRPSFAMLIYPAYLDQGENKSLTPELTLSKETPPVFIFQTTDDQYGNSALVFASAMRNAKLPVELHLLPEGGHGYGLRTGSRAAETWPGLAAIWLRNIGAKK